MFKKPAFPVKNDTTPTAPAATTGAPAPAGKASSSFAAWKQKMAAQKMPPPSLPQAQTQTQAQPQKMPPPPLPQSQRMPPPSLPQPQKMPPPSLPRPQTQTQTQPQSQPQPQRVQPPQIPKDFPPVDYTVPKWACCPPKYPYYLEVLKNGVITRTIDISKKDHYVMGRLPTCDIPLENPSISRYHLVIQHKKDGRVLVYDLGSTHKTKINKHTIAPKTYTYYLTGDILKLGESTQLYILNGGPPREEIMQELTAEEEKAKTQSCNWGMIGDDDEYDDEGEEEEELPGRKRLTLGFEDEDDKKGKKKGKNNKKSLKRKRGEGDDDDDDDEEYDYDKDGDDDSDEGQDEEQREVLIEKKFKKWETLENGDRYIDSDDDEFFDRTGEVEKSKSKAIAREEREKGKAKGPEILCYKDLLAKKGELETKLSGANEELAALKNEEDMEKKNGNGGDELDSLDMFMTENNDSLRNEKIHVLEECIAALEKELAKTEKYLAITKPTLQVKGGKPQRELEYKRNVDQAKTLNVNDFFGEDAPAQKPKPPAATNSSYNPPVEKQRKVDQHIQQSRNIPNAQNAQKQQQQSAQKSAQPRYDDVDDWVPPVGQSGDGFTSLNKKLGY